jgi:large conductance mechanosensitive channel
MGFMKEFKEFAMKGNVIDLAIGIIIGGAFGAIVSSFVNDVIMPPIGLLLGNVDFKNLTVPLKYAADGTVAVALRYGIFINTIISFIIIALSIFIVIKAMNRLRKKEEAKPTPTPEEIVLLRDIRDTLKKKK